VAVTGPLGARAQQAGRNWPVIGEIRIDTEYGHKQTLTKECHVRERQVMEDAMSMSQAIKSLADELKDTVFPHLKGVSQHFIGAAVIIGFAVVLLMAFLKGLESTLQPKVEKLGGALGAWISDRLESLFKAEAKPATEAELDQIAGTVKGLIAKATPERREEVAAEVEKFLGDVLSQCGVPKDHAASIAASTRRSGMELAGIR